MAQQKVYAPEGYHFMVNKQNGFYLMKTAGNTYKSHTINGEKSSLYVLIQVKDTHSTATRSANTAGSSIYSGARAVSPRPSTARSTTVSRSTSSAPTSSGSSSGGSSGGGGGGGY